MTLAPTKKFVTERQASKIIEIPLIEFQRGRWVGFPMPYVRVFGKIRYRLADLNDFLTRRNSK